MWTGAHVFAWGGVTAKGETIATGASYDPVTDRWEALPPAPLAPRVGNSAVWTGTEVVIWGGQDGPGGSFATEGAAFNPSSGRWRSIANAPIAGRSGHMALWIESEMVVLGGYTECCPIDSVVDTPDAAAFDPATDRWRVLPEMPMEWSSGGGRRLVVVDGRSVLMLRDGIGRLDPATGTWTAIAGPIPPPPPTGEPGCGMTGGPALVGAVAAGRMFAWTGGCAPTHGVSHSLQHGSDGSGWEPTADSVLQDTGSWTIAGDDEIFLGSAVPTGVGVHRYDVAANRIEKLDHPGLDIAPLATALWTGEDLLVFNGTRGIDQARPGAAFGRRRDQRTRRTEGALRAGDTA